jgi:hypothetical protein
MSYVLKEILVNTSSDLQKLELSRINCYVLYGIRPESGLVSALIKLGRTQGRSLRVRLSLRLGSGN